MIRLVNAQSGELDDFCRDNPFGCRILTAARCYPNAPFAQFWLQRDEIGRVCAAVSRLEGEGTVCCGSLLPSQQEELAAFLASVGMQSVLAPAGALPGSRALASGEVLCRMQTHGAPEKYACGHIGESARKQASRSVTGEIECEASLIVRELFALFSSCSSSGFRFAATDAAYVDLSHRLRHGFCHANALRDADGALCSAALTTAESDTAALIGGVCTLPQQRGHGLASAVVQALCTRLAVQNKKIFLMAEPEKIPLYLRLGFQSCGGWEQR